MRYVLLSIIALMTLSAVPAMVQAQADRATEGEFLASVNMSDASLTRSGREVSLSFSLQGADIVQPNVRYGVVLVSSDDLDTIVDEYVFDEQITLLGGEKIDRTVVYTAPIGLEGDYTVYIVSKNDMGFPFAFIRAGEASFPPSRAAVKLDQSSCYLTVMPGNKRVTLPGTVSLDDDETLMSHCSVTNIEPGDVSVTPWYETRAHSVFGPTAIALGGSSGEIAFKANETRVIATPLPKAEQRGTYAVTLAYDAYGNDVTYTYRIGNPARIENILLDRSTYNPGKNARIGIVLHGEGRHTLSVALRDAGGDSCGDTVYQSVNLSGTTRFDITVPVTSACRAPQVMAQLTDTTNALVAEAAAMVTLSPKPESKSTSPLTGAERAFDFGPSFFLSVIALAIGLGFLYYTLYRKEKINIPKTPLMFIVALLFGLGIGTGEVHAASFTQNSGACNVNITLDNQGPHIRPGDTIIVGGFTSCPGLQVDATLLNAGYGFSVTANALGVFSGSFSAPSADDNLQYISGDWTPNPLCASDCLMPPYDLIFVNYCWPSTIQNCELPPGGSIFGEKVGWSGGACVGGSTGSCNYTCQSDLTWRMNSNTCSAPPPPPPGSTPEFTSVTPCTISANAASCSAQVSVFVPASYFWGADLKTCGGTQIQTIPPGSHTVSVTVPYDSVCLNLHPWSFLATPSTDTTNVGSSCEPGTSWNASVCAPLPPPPAPTGLNAWTWGSCGTKTIKLIWDPVPGATRYDVERDGILIPMVPNPYVDHVLTDGSTHTYRVRAWNASGPSAWSAPMQGTSPLACVTTGAFTILTCEIQAGQNSCFATVGWTSNAVTPNVTQDGASFSTNQSNVGGISRSVTYGSNVFTLLDGGTTLDTENVVIGCVSGTSWNLSTSRCETPTPPPSALPCAGNEYSGCIVQNTSPGGTSGTCNAATHTGNCSIQCNPSGTGLWDLPGTNNCSLIPVPPPVVTGSPMLSASSMLVRIGTSVIIRWDTNNGSENLCSLTGGTLGTSQNPIPLNPSDPNSEEGSVTQTINGRTTYTLACPSGTTAVTIEVIPSSSET